jgi:cellulose synthase/poly-beta-1,6-N-acetylglucosamine synthase-like glycosyltransferase
MLTILYLIFIIFFIASGNYKKEYLKKALHTSKLNKISIIIPARDEEDNISKILESVINQNYPSDMYEIIVVNDRSSDKTAEIAEEYGAKYTNIRVITITEPGKFLTGKQNALDIGIKSASGDIILLTDADCIVGKNWVKSMNRFFFNDEIGLVVGKTEILEEKNNSFLYKTQALTHRLLMEVAQIPIIFGFYTSGMGNNLALRKSGYFKIGGYEGLGNSILDDEILVRGFALKGYKIAAAFNQNSVVNTKYMDSYSKMFKQHKRWVLGSMNIFTPSGILSFLMYAINLYTIYLLLNFDVICIFKFIADYIFFIKLNRSEKRVMNFADEVLLSIFNTFYIVIVATSAIINPKTSWKKEKYFAPKQERIK